MSKEVKEPEVKTKEDFDKWFNTNLYEKKGFWSLNNSMIRVYYSCRKTQKHFHQNVLK